MRSTLFALITVAAGAPACADFCDDREAQTVFHCQFQNSTRQVYVCLHEDDSYHYAYGKPGQAPELELRHSASRVSYTPWNGIGRAFWARLAFNNGGYRYDVGYSVLKDGSAPMEGVLDVYEPGNETPIATKFCRPGTVESRLDELWQRFR